MLQHVGACTQPHPVCALLPPGDSDPGNQLQKLSLKPTWSPAHRSTDWGVFFQRDVEAGIPSLLQESETTVQKVSSFSALYLAQCVPSVGLAPFIPRQRGILGGESQLQFNDIIPPDSWLSATPPVFYSLLLCVPSTHTSWRHREEEGAFWGLETPACYWLNTTSSYFIREKKNHKRPWMLLFVHKHFPSLSRFFCLHNWRELVATPLLCSSAGKMPGKQPVAWVQSTDKSSISFSPKTSGFGSWVMS